MGAFIKINKFDSFKPLLNFENYIICFRECCRKTSWKKSIQSFWYNLVPNIFSLIYQLKTNTFKISKPDEFKINERGKERLIRSIPIAERLVVKVLCKFVIAPVLLPQLIYHNSACIKGKGTLFAKMELKKHLRQFYNNYKHKGYVLTIDFSKFFQNIDHKILYDKLFKIYKDKYIRWILSLIIDSFGENGLSLGSELSQLLATWYPNPLDHYIKERLHIKYYGRYMDDLYLLHYDKKYLKYCLQQIKHICDELKIIINMKKTKFHKTEIGFKFLQCNFKITITGAIIIKPSKKNALRLRRKLRKFKILLDKGVITYKDIRNTYESWKGHLKNTNCYKMLQNMQKFYLVLFLLDKGQQIAYNFCKKSKGDINEVFFD